LRAALAQKTSTDVALLVGPEGGFSENEVNSAKLAGFIPVTLGPRILRMETAAMAAAALVLYERGDMEMRSNQTAG
jgi:16S rRNA (uracil1498-N3)-methyltransferase